MLEAGVHQAAGLLALASPGGPRLVAVSSHGKQQGELPLLWGLCQTWVELGHSVLVLDGHAQESPQNPGLLQQLESPPGHCAAPGEAGSWTVMAGAHGLAELSISEAASAYLASLFPDFSVILVYADAALLTRLFKHSGLAPLVVLPPLRAASLSAYQAVKQLLLDAQLRPTVANIALSPAANATMSALSPAQQLQHCAMNFLGYVIRPFTIHASSQDERWRDDLNRLALQLLENALILERNPTQQVH